MWILAIIIVFGLIGLAFMALGAMILRQRNFKDADYNVNMAKKVVVITGANTGIGKETAKALYHMGAHVIIACRSAEKASLAMEEISRSFNLKRPEAKIEFMNLDVSSIENVCRFADRFKKRELRLDVLINNAGTVDTGITEEGFSRMFTVNYLGHFMLTHLLLPTMKQNDGEARIVMVSSESHRDADPKRLLETSANFQHLDIANSTSLGAQSVLYGESKLYNVLHCYELNRQLRAEGCTNVTVNALCPGAVHSEFFRNSKFMNFFFKLFAAPPVKGAQTTIHLATSPKLNGISGKYFRKLTEQKSSDLSYNQSLARRLWKASCDLLYIKEEDAKKD